MGFNRYEAKMQAKASLRGAYPHPMLVTLVYMLAASVLPSVFIFLAFRPFFQLYNFIVQNPNMESDQLLRHTARYVQILSSNGLLYLLLYVLLMLFVAVLGFGYTSYALRLARGEQPSYRNLLDGFSCVGRVISSSLLIGVFVFLWEMAALIPTMLIMIPLILLDPSGVLATLVMVVLMLALTVFILSVAYRYSLTYFFLLDHPELGALEAITRSKRTMKGHKWELFVLDLSFLGWELLTPFTLGILGLWVTPYRAAAQANFYDAVTGGCQSGGQPGAIPGPGPVDGSPGPFQS